MDQLPNVSGSSKTSRDRLRDPESGHNRPVHRTAIAIKELGLKLTPSDSEAVVLTPSGRGTIIKPSEVKISLKTGEKRLDEFSDLAAEGVSAALGQGQFGAVYRGTCRNTEVVVKSLHGLATPEKKKDFLQEVEVMNQLVHPNIVLLMGACIPADPSLPWLMVEEFCEKGDLSHVIQTAVSVPKSCSAPKDATKFNIYLPGGKVETIDYEHITLQEAIDRIVLQTMASLNMKRCLYATADAVLVPLDTYLDDFDPRVVVVIPKIKSRSLQRKLRMAQEICSGMAWMAGANILHCDLKPDNILVAKDYVCKIGDFGLASYKNPEEVVVGGTPFWKSPEALRHDIAFERGSKNLPPLLLTESHDVWAFGLIFWELLAEIPLTSDLLWGQYFFKSKILEAIEAGNRPPLEGVVGTFAEINIHPKLQQIIVACWDMRPKARPTFERLIEAIKEVRLDIFLGELDNEAVQIWKAHWFSLHKVAFMDFLRVVGSDLGIEPAKVKSTAVCLSKYFPGEKKKYISLQTASKLVEWFGSIRRMFDLVDEFATQAWFFGPMEGPEANGFLDNATEGAFLVRLNTGSSAPLRTTKYYIHFNGKDELPVHSRVNITDTGRLSCRFYGVSYETQGTIVELVTLGLAEFCKTPCHGSPVYKHKKPASIYVSHTG